MTKRAIIATSLILGIGLALGPALGASAADHISGGVVQCSGAAPKVQVDGWNAYLTGIGGNVDYANAVCYGP